MRESRRASSRSFTSSGKDDARMSKRRCTALDTLLTFCPPAPWARMAVISTSDSGMVRGARRRTCARAGWFGQRTNDPERTMADILEVATREFAEKGLAGARIDDIAEAMRTSKRMIYYYFGSKEGLYIRCWKRPTGACARSRAELHLDDLAPEDALRKLVGFTVDYQLANPDFIRLVMTENIHRGEYLAQSKAIQG
jgi:AcrR family transcriptional regulator